MTEVADGITLGSLHTELTSPFIQLDEKDRFTSIYLLPALHIENLSPPLSSFFRTRWPQTQSTGSGRAFVSMTTQHYGKRSGGPTQYVVFTSWIHGLQAPPMSGSTGGGKGLFVCSKCEIQTLSRFSKVHDYKMSLCLFYLCCCKCRIIYGNSRFIQL